MIIKGCWRVPAGSSGGVGEFAGQWWFAGMFQLCQAEAWFSLLASGGFKQAEVKCLGRSPVASEEWSLHVLAVSRGMCQCLVGLEGKRHGALSGLSVAL